MSELCPPCGTSGNPSMGPYQRHYYRLGSVIRNTVSQSQDTLCRIQLGHIQRMLNDHYAKEVSDRTNYHTNDHETGNPIWSTTPGWATEESKNRGLYPKSLGELCLEIHADRLRKAEKDGYAYWEWYEDVDKLRLAMYHKHTNPEKERKTAKLERLIELVRNA